MKNITTIISLLLLIGCTNSNVQPWHMIDDNHKNIWLTGNVKYHEYFYSPQLDNNRNIIVWLPPSLL